MFRPDRGAILFAVGVLAALCGYLAVDTGRRTAQARRSTPRMRQQQREAAALQQQAHARMKALKDSRP